MGVWLRVVDERVVWRNCGVGNRYGGDVATEALAAAAITAVVMLAAVMVATVTAAAEVASAVMAAAAIWLRQQSLRRRLSRW